MLPNIYKIGKKSIYKYFQWLYNRIIERRNKKLKNKNQKKTIWNLKKLREEAGIKQYEMVEMLGYSKGSTYYCKKEKGLFQFKLNEMIKIKEILSEALGRELTLDEIFCE